MAPTARQLNGITEQLGEARRLGLRRRCRIMVPTLGGGLLALTAWTVCQCLLAAQALPSAAVIVQPISSLLRCLSPVLIMLSILPSDRWALHAVRGLFVLMVLVHLVAFAANLETLARTYEGEPLDSRWGSSDRETGLWLSCCALARRLVNVMSFVWLLLRTFTGASKVNGWRENVLLVQWNHFRCIIFVFFISDLGMGIALIVAGSLDAGLYNIGLSALPELVLGLVMAPSTFRCRIHSWLSSSTQAFAVASTIAGLLAGHDPHKLYEQAAERLRHVPLHQVSEQEFAYQAASVQAVAQAARFGEIDAFVSHSWLDDPELKWKALQEWRAEFKAEFGREPLVWIDKLCIDQSCIALNLACLPIFLASCKNLLVLCGDSYLERLWCIVELFVFSQAGGSLESVTVKLFSRENPGDADALNCSIQKRLADFDVRKASCFDPADTSRLLEVIQGGCDSLQDFNTMIRSLFLHFLEPTPAELRAPPQTSSSASVDDDVFRV